MAGRKKESLWIAVAAGEVQEIRRRWQFRSFRQFSRELHLNERTLRKLDPRHPDGSLSLESVGKIFLALRSARCLKFPSGEWAEEEQRLKDALWRIMCSVTSVPPALAAEVADELEHA